jgi:hypothetical protein
MADNPWPAVGDDFWYSSSTLEMVRSIADPDQVAKWLEQASTIFDDTYSIMFCWMSISDYPYDYFLIIEAGCIA